MALYRQSVFCLRNIVSQLKYVSYIDTRCIHRWVAPTLRELKRRKDKLGPEPVYPRSSYLDWNYNAEIYAFGKRLNENFDDKLLRKALTNRSYILQEELRQQNAGIENPNITLEDNKMLVIEGEEFIRNCVQEFLESSLPKFPKEGIESVIQYLITEDTLSHIASNIGLKDIILCAEFPVANSTLSATLKAVIAALCRSSGEQRANLFIKDFVLTQLQGKDVNELWKIENPMEMLKELLKKRNIPEPEPRLCNESGKNTILATYQVGLYSDKKLFGIGWGENIDIAVEMAARDGLKRIFGTRESMAPFQFSKSPVSILSEKARVVS